MEWNSIEIRKEQKSTPITETQTIQVPVVPEEFVANGNGGFVRKTEDQQIEAIVGHNLTTVNVIGVAFTDASRESYSEHEQADLITDIGSDTAAKLIALAGWTPAA